MNYKEAIRDAAEAAAEAPEGLREIAFRLVLERLLDRKIRQDHGEVAAPLGEPGERNNWEARLMAELPEAHSVQEAGDRKQQTVWAVATLYTRDLDVTTEEIRRVIRTELGVAPQNEQNTARTLRALTPRFVMRRERLDGPGYIYEPTAHSLQIFEDL